MKVGFFTRYNEYWYIANCDTKHVVLLVSVVMIGLLSQLFNDDVLITNVIQYRMRLEDDPE
jgi:hypothetical protein